MPEELWTEVCDTVQEVVSKTIPKKQKCKKAKWLSEEVLQIPEKKREVKRKGEREKYTQLIAEFQRIARRDKKAFLSEQYKETEENNRMSQEPNRRDKKRSQEYTEQLYKKNLMTPITQWCGHSPRARNPEV